MCSNTSAIRLALYFFRPHRFFGKQYHRSTSYRYPMLIIHPNNRRESKLTQPYIYPKTSSHPTHSPPTGRILTFSPLGPKYDALNHNCISSSEKGPNIWESSDPGTSHLYSNLTSAEGGSQFWSTRPERRMSRTSSSNVVE